LAVGPALLLGDQKSACPMGPFDFRSPREQQSALYHKLSAATEAVAPTRHRAVEPPQNTAQFPPTVNFIDSDIFNKMRQDSVLPTKIAGDEEFLRRVTLDLTGQIPDSPTVTAFLADTAADKRAKKIDQLLDRRERLLGPSDSAERSRSRHVRQPRRAFRRKISRHALPLSVMPQRTRTPRSGQHVFEIEKPI